MFVSDFAIRRPIVTVVTMIALVVFGLAVAGAARHRRVSRHRRADRLRRHRLPRRGARRRRARSRHAHRGQDLRHQRRRQDQLDVDRRLRADHRPVRVLEAGRSGDAGHSRRDLRGARAAPGRDPRADHPALRSESAADRLARAHVDRAHAAAAHADSPTRRSPASCARSPASRR